MGRTMKQAYGQNDLMRRAVAALASIAANVKAQEKNTVSPGWYGRLTALLPGWAPHLPKFIFELLIFVFVLAFAGVIVKSTLKHGTVIEPFNVPPELASRGYTGAVVAQQLIDEVYAVIFSARTTRAARYRSHRPQSIELLPSVASNLTVPQIDVPGTGISMTAIVYYLRDLFGIYDTKITGEVVRENPIVGGNDSGVAPRYSLHLRSSEQAFYFRSPKPDEKLENILEAAALPLLEKLSPYIAGVVYWRKSDLAKATAMAQQCLASDSADERQWGMNLRGVISVTHHRYSEARASLVEAHNKYPEFPVLSYNLGSLSYQEQNYLTALEEALDGVLIDANPIRQSTGYSHAGQALNAMRREGVPFKGSDHLLQVLDYLFGNTARPTMSSEVVLDVPAEGDPRQSGAEALGLKEGEAPGPKPALAMLRRAMRADPTQAEAFFWSGVIEFAAGDKSYAEQHLELAVSLFSEKDSAGWRSEAHRTLGRLYGDDKKFDAAFAEFKSATDLDNKPTLPLLYWAQAIAKRIEVEHPDVKTTESYRAEAAAKLELAIAMTPDDMQFRKEAAETFKRLKMIERAKKLLEPTAPQGDATAKAVRDKAGTPPAAPAVR
jgi:tetratricopeptide (TPR) repeat protein